MNTIFVCSLFAVYLIDLQLTIGHSLLLGIV